MCGTYAGLILIQARNKQQQMAHYHRLVKKRNKHTRMGLKIKSKKKTNIKTKSKTITHQLGMWKLHRFRLFFYNKNRKETSSVVGKSTPLAHQS